MRLFSPNQVGNSHFSRPWLKEWAPVALIVVLAGSIPAPAATRNSVSVSLSAKPDTVLFGGAVALAATVSGTSSTGVSWYVNGILQGSSSVGTISGQGDTATYHVPSTAGTYTVMAVSNYNTGSSASATITVINPAVYNAVAVTITPATASVAPGGSVNITGAVSGASSNPGLSWSVNGIWAGNSSVGTVPGSGNTVTYQAPTTPGTYTVTATSDYNSSKSASATVTVAGTPTVGVTVNPAAASVSTGGTASFTAAVSGSSNTAVTWSVDGVAGGSSTVGTVSGTGASATYTAPASAGSHTLKATSSADSTKSASAAIGVLATPVTVSTSPASATLNPGGTVAISATVGGTGNTAVTWTVDGLAGGSSTVGTITGSGATVTYTAPGATGSHTVTATSAANGASSASTAVTVQASSGSTVVALANSTTYAGINGTVNGSGTVLMTATVAGLANTTVTWTVDGVAKGNSTVGTVNSGVAMGSANNWGNTALYVAPATPGTHSITATASDGTQSAPLLITVGTPYVVANATIHTVPAPTGEASTDTSNIQSAMGAGGIVQFQAGTYNVACGSGEYVFEVPSNVTFQFPAGCAIHASKAPSGGGIFLVNGASNVNFIGAGPTSIIDGGYPSNVGNAADIMIWSGSNITIAGLTLENAPLDGITVEGCYATTNAKSILVYGCTINSNGRNGMSPCGVDDLIVRDSTLSHNLHNPAAGIDFECNSNQRATYCFVFNDVMNSNSDGTYGGLIQSGPDNSGSTGIMSDMVFAFLTGSANCGFGIEAQNCSAVQILNNTISGTTNGEYGGVGIDIVGSRSSTNLLILGNTITGCAGNAIQVEPSGATGDYVEYNTYTGCGSGIVASSGVTVANNAQ
jgi:hypothetical protein